MSDRLISADALADRLDSLAYDDWNQGASTSWANAYSECAEMVRSEMSTVDAVPVVRCKDCKWFEIAQLKRDGTDDKRYKPSMCMIGTYAKPRKADWYCADGERREDGKAD